MSVEIILPRTLELGLCGNQEIQNSNLGSHVSGSRITSGPTEIQTDYLQNQRAAITPVCTPMPETAHKRSSESTQEMTE